METAFEIILRMGDAEATSWFDDGLTAVLQGAEGLASLDIYRPADAGAADPLVDDGAPWPRLAMMIFPRTDALAAFVATPAFTRLVADRPARGELTADAFERRLYNVGDARPPTPLAAPFSYVVRYAGNVGDTENFRDYYLESHYALLARLPKIRNLMNYVPLPAIRTPLSSAHYAVGNEVVFDTLADFNAAMASPLRQEIRDATLAGPKAPPSVHFPMLRRRVFGA